MRQANFLLDRLVHYEIFARTQGTEPSNPEGAAPTPSLDAKTLAEIDGESCVGSDLDDDPDPKIEEGLEVGQFSLPKSRSFREKLGPAVRRVLVLFADLGVHNCIAYTAFQISLASVSSIFYLLGEKADCSA